MITSQFTTLLLGIPIKLPTGIARIISSDRICRRPLTTGQQKNNERNASIRIYNIELIFDAVAEGFDTIHGIENHTGLCEATVKSALKALEEWEVGPRIKRRAANGRHYFSVRGAA